MIHRSHLIAPAMTPARSGNAARESGFVLLAGVWFVALLALVAAIIAGWMTRSLGLAQRLQDRLAAQTAIISAENQIAYRVLTGFFSGRGLELPGGGERDLAMSEMAIFEYEHKATTAYAALDNRPYRFGELTVRLQDEGGLFAINYASNAALSNLLRSYGVPYTERGALIDRLLDYTGKSELYRLNGATAEDYARAGRTPPRNAPLLTPWEARRVLSWDEYPVLWTGADPLPDVVTVADRPMLNPNTAPAPVLRSFPGMTDETAQKVIQYRTRYRLQGLYDLERVGAAAVSDPMSFLFFPSGNIRMTLSAEKARRSVRVALRLTPLGEAPFRIDWTVALPAPDSVAPESPADARPALPDAGDVTEGASPGKGG